MKGLMGSVPRSPPLEYEALDEIFNMNESWRTQPDKELYLLHKGQGDAWEILKVGSDREAHALNEISIVHVCA